MESFYQLLDDGLFESSTRTAGPWGPEAQHAGPPSALFAREFSRHGEIGDKRIASISVDILSPVPISPLDVRVRVDKPGRRVELLSGEIRAGDKVVMAARAWRVLKAPDDLPTIGSIAKLSEPKSRGEGDGVGREVMPGAYTGGYLSAVEWLQAPEDEGKPVNEARSAWIRPLIPLVAGETVTGTELAMLTADSGSGVHVPVDPFHHQGINCTLHVAFVREPEGNRIGLESRTSVEPGGCGLTSTTLYDRRGVVGTGTQSLLFH